MIVPQKQLPFKIGVLPAGASMVSLREVVTNVMSKEAVELCWQSQPCLARVLRGSLDEQGVPGTFDHTFIYAPGF